MGGHLMPTRRKFRKSEVCTLSSRDVCQPRRDAAAIAAFAVCDARQKSQKVGHAGEHGVLRPVPQPPHAAYCDGIFPLLWAVVLTSYSDSLSAAWLPVNVLKRGGAATAAMHRPHVLCDHDKSNKRVPVPVPVPVLSVSVGFFIRLGQDGHDSYLPGYVCRIIPLSCARRMQHLVWAHQTSLPITYNEWYVPTCCILIISRLCPRSATRFRLDGAFPLVVVPHNVIHTLL
jgi:hypothetical protein